MRINKKAILASILAVSVQAQADVTLTAGEGVSILAINGVEFSNGSLLDNAQSIHLEDGVHQLVAQYTAEVKKDGDYEVEKSSTQVIVFEANNANIKLETPIIDSYAALQKFNINKAWMLSDTQTGKAVSFKSDELKKEGMQLARDYTQELFFFNNSSSIAAIPTLNSRQNNPYMPKNSIIKSASTMESKTTIDANNMAESMLRYWYKQASNETKVSFKKWLETQ